MNRTGIEWSDYSWNPLTGCLHNCAYCYAERMTKRFSGDVRVNLTNSKCKKENGIYILDEAFIGDNGKVVNYPYGFSPTFHKYRLDWPGNVKNGANIFVGSMADIFGQWVPSEIITDIFNACRKYPQHNYLFLTKNPSRYLELYDSGLLPSEKNMWFGTSVPTTDTQYYHSEIHNNFISIEPLLTEFSGDISEYIDWAIIGAETGRRKSKIVPQKEWIDYIVERCDKKKIPVFMKDSLLPIVGKENMRRDFPDVLTKKKLSDKMHNKLYDKCFYCKQEKPMKEMTAMLYRKQRGDSAKKIGYACEQCFNEKFGGVIK